MNFLKNFESIYDSFSGIVIIVSDLNLNPKYTSPSILVVIILILLRFVI